jgi:hypothetical protein
MTDMAHPYTAERLAEEHRRDLLRSAESWRLARMAEPETTSDVKSTKRLSGWLGKPIWLPRPLVFGLHRRREATTALCACSCPPRT